MDKVQATLGIARTELVVLIVLIGGLTAGLMIKYLIAEDKDIYYSNSDSINHILDSLAEAESELFTGTNDTTAIKIAKSEINKDDSINVKFSADNLPDSTVNINTATKEMLMKLPGIGTKTADEIIAYRVKKPFRKKLELMEVKGIGDKKYEKMKSFIDVK